MLASVVEVEDGTLPVDDLVAVEKGLAWVHVPHLHAEQVLFGHHRADSLASKVVHSEWLHVADRVACPEDADEAADS